MNAASTVRGRARAQRRKTTSRTVRRATALRSFRLESLEDRKLLSINVSDPTYWGDMVDNAAFDDGPLNDGILTINGDLTFSDDGSIHGNDDRFLSTDPLLIPNASAFPITIVVTGDVLFGAGTSLVSENQRAGGNGGDISLAVGANLTLETGAKISSSKTAGAGDTGIAGNISIDVGGNVVLFEQSVITANGTGLAGDISLLVEGNLTMHGGAATTGASIATDGGAGNGGIITVAVLGDILMQENTSVITDGLSGGAIVMAAENTRLDGLVSSHGTITGVGPNQPPGGGPITIAARELLTIGDSGIVSSSGRDPGADLVHLEACEIVIYGLVESTGAGHAVPNSPPTHLNGLNRPDKDINSTAGVEVWAGRSLLIDSLNHNGQVNADLTLGAIGRTWIDLFSIGDITIIGDASGPFAVHATNGGNNPTGGAITVKSTGGNVTASELAIDASAGGSGFPDGGTIVVEASGNVDLDGAVLLARGDFDGAGGYGDGGHIQVRAYNGSVRWQNGIGDVRPTGIDPPPPPTLVNSGTILLTYNTFISVAGSSFPTGGSTPNSLPPADPPFPDIVQNTAGGSPVVPVYVIFPLCSEELCAICSGETFVFGSTPEWGTVTYVTFDFNPVANGGVPAILTDGNQTFKDALAAVTTFVYNPLDVLAVQNQKGVHLWYVQIDVGADAILVKDGVVVQTQRYYGKAGRPTSDDPTPGMTFQTTCHVTVEGDQDLSSGNQGGGKIIVQSHNDLAGDLTIEAWGGIVVDGTVGNGVSGTLGKPGTINLLSLCGDIHVGPTGRVEVVGQDLGGGGINIVTGEVISECGCNKGIGGDILIEGLVQAHSKAPSETTMPTVNIVAFDGEITIDGNNRFGIDAATKTPITSGVHVFNRHNPVGGEINIQAAQDIQVIGNIILNNSQSAPTQPRRDFGKQNGHQRARQRGCARNGVGLWQHPIVGSSHRFRKPV